MKTIKIRIIKNHCGGGDHPPKISGDVHVVPDDLESMDPEEAYGIGHEAGKGHKDNISNLFLEESKLNS